MASDLVVRFGDILQNPTLFPQEQGRLNIVLGNQGDTSYNGPVDFKLYASTDNVLDPLNTLGQPRGSSDRLEGLDELLGSLNGQTVNLAPGQSQTFTVDFAGSEFRTASIVSPGVYYLIAQVEPSNNVTDSNTANNVATQRITNGDVVIQWNSILLNAIQFSGKGAGTPGTPPPIGARNQAIVHAAIYDAVNAIDRTRQPYLVNISASQAAGASKEAAAVEAAYQTLVTLFTDETYLQQTVPQQFIPNAAVRNALKATFDAERERSLAAIPDGVAEDRGIAIGRTVAQQILANRANDGSVTAQGPYTPGTDIGRLVK